MKAIDLRLGGMGQNAGWKEHSGNLTSLSVQLQLRMLVIAILAHLPF